MSSIKAIPSGPNSWDFYAIERDEFLTSVVLDEFETDKKTCRLSWENSEGLRDESDLVEVLQFAATEVIFSRQLVRVTAVVPLTDPTGIRVFEKAGFLPGREFGVGAKRALRFSCDRYDLVRSMAETQMGLHLDMNLWSFGWDSAKKRLGVCKYGEHRISLSRYFVDLHSLDEIDQVIRHEVAHAIAGPKAGHSRKWKDIATKLGYRHERISGDEIGNATAKLIGTCPNGHVVFRHRRPKSPLSCSRCSTRFDRRFLLSWTER